MEFIGMGFRRQRRGASRMLGDSDILNGRCDLRPNHCSSRIRYAILRGVGFNPYGSPSLFRLRWSTAPRHSPSSKKRIVTMTVRFRRDVAAAPLAIPAPSSVLVRRLLFRSQNNPARRRMLTWLLAVDDARLQEFALRPQDIAILRRVGRGQRE